MKPKAFPDLVELNVKGDHRGQLVALEEQLDVPFNIKRIFYIFGTQQDIARGNHSHYKTEQFLICVKGCCSVTLDNSSETKTYVLDSPNKALFQDALLWGSMHSFSADCVLLVLANMFYDESDYIRNYDEFVALFDSKDLNLDKR